MSLPGNVDVVRVRGYWFDQDGGGSGKTITFVPYTSNLTDATAFSYIKTAAVTVTPDPTTAYFFADLIASNDPDLTPSAWTVTLQGQTPFTIAVDYNASVQDVGGGDMRKAVWLVDAAGTGSPPPPILSYYTSAQTNAAIAEAIDGLTITSAVTSVSGRTGDVVLVEGDITGLVADLAAKTVKSTLTTKGDLYVASAASTPARLGVGSNAQVHNFMVANASAWASRTPTQAKASLAITEADVSGLVSDLAAKQPLDSDLTTIAGLTPGAGNVLAADGSGWTSKSYSGLKTSLAITPTDIGAQPVDSDLTTIAGLTATTDNFMVAAGSAWASRTPTQAKTSLAITASDVGSGVFTSARLPLVASTPYTITYSGSITIDPTLGNNPQITATGNPTIGISTTGVLNGQQIMLEVLAQTTQRTVTLTGINILPGLSSVNAITVSKVGFHGFRYSALNATWHLMSYAAST